MMVMVFRQKSEDERDSELSGECITIHDNKTWTGEL